MRGTKNAIEQEREDELRRLAGFINNQAVEDRLMGLCFDSEATTGVETVNVDGEDLDYYNVEQEENL